MKNLVKVAACVESFAADILDLSHRLFKVLYNNHKNEPLKFMSEYFI